MCDGHVLKIGPGDVVPFCNRHGVVGSTLAFSGRVPAGPVSNEVIAVPVERPEACPCQAVAWHSKRWRARRSDRVVGYQECAVCGTLRLEPWPTETELASAYQADYFGAGTSKFVRAIQPIVLLTRGRRVRKAVALLRRVSGNQRARVLDLGCGDGTFLEQMMAHGYSAAGTELSVETSRRASRIESLDLRTGMLDEDSFPPATFQLITAWHVVEHLPDPSATLRLCRKWLAPEGRLVIAVPNAASWQARVFRASWFHLDPPRHLYQLSASSLARILATNGFEVVATRHFNLSQNVYGWLQSALNAMGGRPAQLYEFFKGNEKRTALWRWIGALIVGGVLLPPSLAAAAGEAASRRGGTIEVVARIDEGRERRS
jgi:2-polyprenyl-3-methyl-5-hydroxy-6-metoxy-1,4-benzoquinol methylase